jgi:hypothetical protein
VDLADKSKDFAENVIAVAVPAAVAADHDGAVG